MCMLPWMLPMDFTPAVPKQRWSLFSPMLSTGPSTLGLSQQQLMQNGDKQSPYLTAQPEGTSGPWGGSAVVPRSQPLPAQVEGQRDPSSPTVTKWGHSQREELPFPSRCPSPPQRPRGCSPTASPHPKTPGSTPTPPSHPQLRRPLPSPLPNFPHPPPTPRQSWRRGGGAGPPPYSRARGAARCPRGGGGGGSASRSARLAARLPVPRRPTPDDSGRPCGLYVALGGRGSANERGEGCRCQWRAGRWGCAELIYCPKLQWKHGRAAPGDKEPKYDGGTR